jgi:hypothetical protein
MFPGGHFFIIGAEPLFPAAVAEMLSDHVLG